MHNSDVIKVRGRERQVECGSNILDAHGGTELPGHDVAREVVEYGREIVPSPAGDLEVSEVRLPMAVVLSLNSFAALITTYAGLVMRSCAFSSR